MMVVMMVFMTLVMTITMMVMVMIMTIMGTNCIRVKCTRQSYKHFFPMT